MSAQTEVLRFVARQPILDQKERLYGYELLFRSSLDNVFNAVDGEAATRDVVDNFFTTGAQELAGGHRAFINCTRNFLVNEYTTLLPKEEIAIEILETIEPDDEVLAAIRKLKRAGYCIVLDDFVFNERFQPFIELADIIKVDFRITPRRERKSLAAKFLKRGIKLLAEKVETREEFEQGVAAGYVYFQGYFFCRPQILTSKTIPAFKLHYIELLRAIAKPELDVNQLEQIIESEVGLSYKLLRLVNTAAFGVRGRVDSIRRALLLLGEREVKKWAYIVALINSAQDKPHELAVTSLVRARCCELLTPIGRHDEEPEFFLTGLFSLMDAILGLPMSAIVKQLALPEQAAVALAGGENLLHRVYELVCAYERADWPQVSRLAAELRFDESAIPTAYLNALDWAAQVFSANRGC